MSTSGPTLNDKVVMVTGASRGLGRAMALAFIDAGARVIITASRESPQLDTTLRMAADHGAGEDRVKALVGDVGKAADCARIAAQALEHFGSVDVLINNAGIAMNGPGQPMHKLAIEDWLAMVSANVNGPFLMARHLVNQMIERGWGRIVNISTSDRTMVRATYSPYGPTKAFLEAASRIWSEELLETGVTVNVLAPGGAVDTYADVSGVPTPGRNGLPITVMNAPALWLASDLSNGHTGQRFMGNRWNEALPLEDRIRAAREDGAESVRIM
jgi:NAD(P)-dependent dehydrogenase (short-subunit alcohol dehydrogenase family)